jgi:eukaryotic-like serine/threonine-protein kinase
VSDQKRHAPTLTPTEPARDELGRASTQIDRGRARALDTSECLGVGEVLGGRYRILEELGRGGEGVVYGAHDLRADQVVALKLLRHDEGRLEGYRRELQMARRVTHENAVRIHDIVDLPDRFGLSMEFVRGETLEKRLGRAGPMGYEKLLGLARDLASALAAAHAAGVTHRDLKPSNVILRSRSERAVVTDFGIARLHDVDDAAPVSRAAEASRAGGTTLGTLVGTPLYMAPEQLAGERDIGPAADVYAFGLLMREAATGKTLHEGAATSRGCWCSLSSSSGWS